MIEDFVVQWRKMKDALERQEERLTEQAFEGGRLRLEEYQALIRRVIEQLDQLLKAHEALSRLNVTARARITTV